MLVVNRGFCLLSDFEGSFTKTAILLIYREGRGTEVKTTAFLLFMCAFSQGRAPISITDPEACATDGRLWKSGLWGPLSWTILLVRVHSPELSIFSATANHMTKPRGPQPYSPNWSKIPFILQRKIWIYPPLVRHAKRDGVLVCFSFGHGEGLELRTFVTILITIDGIIAMFFVVLWSSRRFWGLEPSSRLGHIGAWGRALGREFEIFWILSDQHSILYQREQSTR